ncbi:FecR domain-containing protein [Pseudoalteromonas neustonica]|uniref:FecR domain-containing protein n=1 Tax=Pseudoalteromonas neustonica TaxID=1840331 RepID=A0ABU9U755_9GAMM|nr:MULTISPECIES: FecR domain-containing protein [Pseudoalteromonas]
MMNNSNKNQQVFEQATLWLLRLKDEPSEQQIHNWQKWLKICPQNAEAFEESVLLDAKLGNLSQQSMERLLALLPKSNIKKVSFIRPLVALAASLAVIAVSFFHFNASRPTIYLTQIGETASFILSDGSQILLDSDTELNVEYSDNTRRIELLKGQVIFDVTPEKQRPFIVVVEEIDIKVLGTQFNVNRLKDQVVVAVKKGKVKVTDPTVGDVFLTANQGYNSINDRQFNLTETQFAIWQQGRIQFSNTPLNFAVEQLNRYQDKPFKLKQTSLNQLSLSGTYQLNDIDNTAKLLPKVLPVDVIDNGYFWLIQQR